MTRESLPAPAEAKHLMRTRHAPIILALAASGFATGAAAQQRTPPAAPAARPPVELGTLLRVELPGEVQLRYSGLTDIPLAVTPGRTDQSATLGQNSFFEGWIRLRPRVSIGERFRVNFQFDVARAVVPDAPAQDVGLAIEPRGDLFPYGAFDVRQGYIEWDSPVGVIRAGQQGFTWGLGLLANDGDRAPTFGDYRFGDLVERVAIATRPAGRNSDLVVALAGDLVYRDRLTSLAAGDIALQGVATVFYQDHACRADCDRRRLGALATYRDVSFREGDFLRVVVGDLLANWDWPTPDGAGRVFAGAELALIAGTTNAARTVNVDTHDVLQFGGLARVGIERRDRYRFALEAGYASGDRNPVDDGQRRFNFNPSHRVGMILFPELIAWQTARSASIAGDPSLVGRGANGRRLLPSNGGVTGAAYLYPTAIVNLGQRLDLRFGAVIGVATTDWVDPTSVQIYGTARNYRGGDATKRDLGVELDLGVNGRFPLPGHVTLTGGLQGAVLFAGRAFDDAAGRGLGRVGMATARLGMEF